MLHVSVQTLLLTVERRRGGLRGRSDILLAAAGGAVGDGVAGLRLAPGTGRSQHASADDVQEGSSPGDEDG